MRISGTEDPEDSVKTSSARSGRVMGERVTVYAGRTAGLFVEWCRGDVPLIVNAEYTERGCSKQEKEKAY